MRVIIPVDISDANLISSTIAEPDLGAAWAAYSTGTVYSEGMRCTDSGKVYQSRRDLNLNHPLPVSPAMLTMWWDTVTEALYSAITTYGLGAQVVDTETHRRIESLQDGNIGHALPIYPQKKNDWWLDIGATNRWACLDSTRNTQSIASGSFTVVVKPGMRINSLALMGLDAAEATIDLNITHPLFPKTFKLLTKPAVNYWEYCYAPFSYTRSLILFDIPPVSDLEITITLTKPTAAPIRLGSIFPGSWVYLGDTEYEAESDELNFSTIERDIDGTATLTPRQSLPKTNQTTWIDKSNVNAVRAAKRALNARPAVYCGLDDLIDDGYYEALQIVGIYKSFLISLKHPDKAKVTLELEEI